MKRGAISPPIVVESDAESAADSVSLYKLRANLSGPSLKRRGYGDGEGGELDQIGGTMKRIS